ncbi:MAG: glycosyl hydrolase [Anaerolineae bacterium]|nr:glycosyl hydrolase [Anaerolineae bacterium]
MNALPNHPNQPEQPAFSTKAFREKYTQQARRIVAQMSLAQKVALMGGKTNIDAMVGFEIGVSDRYNLRPYPAGGCEAFGIPEIQFCDGPRGVVCGNSTCFPVSMARGATFDVHLEERIGEAIAREVRAHGGNFFGGVCINLPYHPGWGRSQETYGEDSFHLGQMGSALVRGVQKHGVIACVKHYAFNSMEISRYKVSVECARRTEREVFLPHFEECIRAGAASVMTAYNRYQGVHCGHHHYLIRSVLKDEWGFDGFVISDFGQGIRETVAPANAGLDIEMCDTKFYGENLLRAVQAGEVSQTVIDEAALRIVRTMLALGADHSANETYPPAVIACQAHTALALEAAEKSITLLKNEHRTLPLSKHNIKKLAVIGALGDQDNMGDHGSSRVFPPYAVTPFDGIASLNICEVFYSDGSNLQNAKELAQMVDAVVFVVGYTHEDEGEFVPLDHLPADTSSTARPSRTHTGGDRTQSLSLHPSDIRLIKEVAPLNRRSIVVLIGGNMILIEEWKDDVAAILMAYYPGMEGGTALARTLFGEVNPSGKLPFALVRDAKHLPPIQWDTEEQFYEYYHGYTRLEKKGIEPALPYGFGLSYTTYRYSDAAFWSDAEAVYAACDVENCGSMDGEEVVQFYVGFDHSKTDRPHKLLRGFERLPLKAGEKKRVVIRCPIQRLCWYNDIKGSWELENMLYQAYIGPNGSDRHLLKGSFTL